MFRKTDIYTSKFHKAWPSVSLHFRNSLKYAQDYCHPHAMQLIFFAGWKICITHATYPCTTERRILNFHSCGRDHHKLYMWSLTRDKDKSSAYGWNLQFQLYGNTLILCPSMALTGSHTIHGHGYAFETVGFGKLFPEICILFCSFILRYWTHYSFKGSPLFSNYF